MTCAHAKFQEYPSCFRGTCLYVKGRPLNRSQLAGTYWNLAIFKPSATPTLYATVFTFSRNHFMRLAHVKSVLLSVGIHAIIGISGPSCRHRDGERSDQLKNLRVRVPWGVSRQLLNPRGWDVAKRSRQWK